MCSSDLDAQMKDADFLLMGWIYLLSGIAVGAVWHYFWIKTVHFLCSRFFGKKKPDLSHPSAPSADSSSEPPETKQAA